MKYAEVYLYIKTLELDHSFDYSIPQEFIDSLHIGYMVIVPFGSRKEIGFVSCIKESTDLNQKDIKPLQDIIGSIPLFDEQGLRLIYWMSEYYFQPVSKIIEFFLPPGKKEKIIKVLKNPESFFKYKNAISLCKSDNPDIKKIYDSRRLKAQQRILDILIEKNSVYESELLKMANTSRKSLSSLLDKGLIEEKKERIKQKYEEKFINNKSSGEINKNKEVDIIKNSKDKTENLKDLFNHINKRQFGAFVLYDFNLKDKKDIISILTSYTVRNKSRVLILSPEIIDSERLFTCIYDPGMHGKSVIYHSELSETERLSKWYEIYSNNIDTVFGNRSAIFLPCRDVGLIFVDEEHDPSYKESTIVRYNLRDIAIKMGYIFRTPVVFASNTPSMDLWFKSVNNKDFRLIRSKNSFYAGNNVAREIIDLKEVDSFKEDINITGRLFKIVKNEVEKGNRALVFVNRRGYSSYVICKDCGNIPGCPKCNIPYSYHSIDKKLVCHHCSNTEIFNGKCIKCGSFNMLLKGVGIEKIESKLINRFKGVKVLRIDSDLVKNKKERVFFNKILDKNKSLIIIGTRKALSSFSIDNLTVAGIIDFDSLFQLPDFQTNERVFQTLEQVLSRIEDSKRSKFLIQTYNINNDVLSCFVSGDFENFYNIEIKNRKDLFYPPFSRLINITISGKDNESVKRDIDLMAKKIKSISGLEFMLLGPAPAPFYRINFYFRWHILIKTDSIINFNNRLRSMVTGLKRDESNKLIYDVDPVCIL